MSRWDWLLTVVLSLFSAIATAVPKEKCETWLAGAEIGYAPQKKNLLRHGFRQFGQSGYFGRAGFIVELRPSGGFRVFTAAVGAFFDAESTFLGIRVRPPQDAAGDKGLNVVSMYFEKDSRYYVEKFGGERERMQISAKEARSSTLKNQRQNFLNEGAVEIEGSSSLLSLVFPSVDKEEPRQWIAIFDHDRLVQLVEEVAESVTRAFSPETEFAGFRMFSNAWLDGLSAVRFRRGVREFEITDAAMNGRFVLSPSALNSLPEDLSLYSIPPSSRRVLSQGQQPAFEQVAPHLDGAFIGHNEDLKALLLSDDDNVRRHFRLDHHQMAAPFFRILDALTLVKIGAPHDFVYQGYRYLAEMKPLGEASGADAEASYDVTLSNLDTGKKMTFSELLPSLIDRYGFYGGRRSENRLDSKDIVELFPFLLTGRSYTKEHNDYSTEELALLLTGLQLRASGSPVRVSFDDADGAGHQIEFSSISAVKVKVDGTVRIDFGGPGSASVVGTPQITWTPNRSVLHVTNVTWQTLSGDTRPITGVEVHFTADNGQDTNSVRSNSFSLSRLSRYWFSPQDLKGLAGFINAEYVGSDPQPVGINLYSQKSEAVVSFALQNAAVEGESIVLTGTVSGHPATLTGRVDDVWLREDVTEVVLYVETIKIPDVSPDDEWRASFRVSFGSDSIVPAGKSFRSLSTNLDDSRRKLRRSR